MSNSLTREPECCAFAARPRHRKHRRKLVTSGEVSPLIFPLHYIGKSYVTQVIEYKRLDRVKGIEQCDGGIVLRSLLTLNVLRLPQKVRWTFSTLNIEDGCLP